MATKAKQTFGVIEGAVAYAKIAQPDTKYKSDDKEYSITVFIDEDAADEWDAVFTKQPSKKVKASEFEAKYKFPCPIEGAKNVYFVQLKKDATKDGVEFNPEYRPRVLLDDENGERVDITESRLIANGSYAKISYRINENSYGTFAYLKNVLMDVDGFKEYVSEGGGAMGSEFGGDKPIKKEAARSEATNARKAKPVEDEEEEDDEPPKKAPAKPAAKVAAKPAKKVIPDDEDEDDQEDSGSKSPF